ncbi:MAG: hypothetical protein E7Z87_08520 [Cyanobacteria bacterium SIG26]|nr:hypothetical protein [Cyanobacteria bacterium SIG26]MBQ7127026.1 hypothetical protein [bacterium]
MVIKFSKLEKEILLMLISGHNSRTITQWFGLEQKQYLKIKQSVFKKLGISRSIQILQALLKLQHKQDILIQKQKAD